MNKNDIKCLPIQMRINIWLLLGERGISSNTICYVLSGTNDFQLEGFEEELRWLGSPPKDPSDFRRCRELLEIIPEWKSRLKEVSYVFPAWKSYAENWDKMEELYQEECNNKSGLAPKLYDFMKSLRS